MVRVCREPARPLLEGDALVGRAGGAQLVVARLLSTTILVAPEAVELRQRHALGRSDEPKANLDEIVGGVGMPRQLKAERRKVLRVRTQLRPQAGGGPTVE